jgi:hypothetical protein
VKLQAAVRGHLVRRHAVGTLRCVQAIVKMQLLVRARHAQKSQPDAKNDYSKTSVFFFKIVYYQISCTSAINSTAGCAVATYYMLEL